MEPAPGRHHIGAVVGHFLADARGGRARAGAGPAAAGFYRFAVGSPDSGRLAAWTAARLALAAAGRGGWGRETAPAATGPLRVTLQEWHRQPWTAASLLGGDDAAHLRSLFRPALSPADRPPLEVCAGQDAAPASAAGAVAWLNLGRVDAAVLTDLRDAPPAVDGLVWCHYACGGDMLRRFWRLVHLANRLSCVQLKVLRFSPPWADWLGEGGLTGSGVTTGGAPAHAPPARLLAGRSLESLTVGCPQRTLDPSSDQASAMAAASALCARVVHALLLQAAGRQPGGSAARTRAGQALACAGEP